MFIQKEYCEEVENTGKTSHRLGCCGGVHACPWAVSNSNNKVNERFQHHLARQTYHITKIKVVNCSVSGKRKQLVGQKGEMITGKLL